MQRGIHRVRVKLASGAYQTYFYAWRGGPRLHSSPNSKEQALEYAAALLAQRDARNPKYTLTRLISDYRASSNFLGLADGTRRYRKLYLAEIDDKFGKMSFEALEDKGARRHFIKWRDKFITTPKGADMRMETLRCVLTFGVDMGDIGVNRAKGIATLHSANRSDIVWLDSEVAALRLASPEPVRRVIDLARLTGLRKGDLIALSWTAVKEDRIVWKPLKTRHLKNPPTVYVPVVPELRALLDSWPMEATTVLTNAHKMPWKPNALQNAFQRTKAKAADIAKKQKADMTFDKHFHDFRGTFATYLCRAGLSNEQVALIMGWSEANIAQIRRKYVDDSVAMDAVIRQLTVK